MGTTTKKRLAMLPVVYPLTLVPSSQALSKIKPCALKVNSALKCHSYRHVCFSYIQGLGFKSQNDKSQYSVLVFTTTINQTTNLTITSSGW